MPKRRTKTRVTSSVAPGAASDGGGPAFPIVGVGASAGGLEAFTELLKHLPVDTGFGFVLVQHLDPQHESKLASLLGQATTLPVQEVTGNQRVEPNRVYVIPPNASLRIAHGVLKLEPRLQTRTPQHPIDAFFESLADDRRERAVGVILSGTATDGTLGMEAIKAAGGITFAQDDSARYDSMPRHAAAAGSVDLVLSPALIAKELGRMARHAHFTGAAPRDGLVSEHGLGDSGADVEAPTAMNAFKKVLSLLRNHSGVDFSLYKLSTIRRRVTRRLLLSKKPGLEPYAGFLRGNSAELDALHSDLLISVTSFFRNPDAFELLKRKVFPKLLRAKGDDPIRVWVLGCSTGQEAYSIAITFLEAADQAPRMRKLQVFATDLNDALLDKARAGHYPKSVAADLSAARLRRFFTEEEGGYRVVKPVREMVIFARQNLIGDPPFSRLDLVSCRNLLIYLEPSAQGKALPTFHYALKPGGFLFLGASESVGRFTELFEPLDRKHRIYVRRAVSTPALRMAPTKKVDERPPGRASPRRVSRPPGGGAVTDPAGFRAEHNAQREADRVTISQFAPPGVLIDGDLQVLQFRGPTSAYLEPPTGKASFDLLKMAREGLLLPLRSAINRAKREFKPVRKENLSVRQNGATRLVNLVVIPLRNPEGRRFLVLFEDAARTGQALQSGKPGAAVGPPRPGDGKEAQRRIAHLESELAETREYLQYTQEQQAAANEELQAGNEEIQSANEELQSLNEELETSKEELESSNEELTTVNEEMATRNTELNRLNNDLVNLQTSTKLAIVLLGPDLVIRRFSPQAEKRFGLMAGDIGRPLSRVRHNLEFGSTAGEGSADLDGLVAEVVSSLQEREREVRDREGRWYSLRVRPYLTLDNKVDGAVLVLVDIDHLKRVEQAVTAERDYAEAIIRTSPNPLVILNAELRVERANDAFHRTFKLSGEESQGRLIYDLGNRQWNIPRLRILLEEILPRNSFFDGFEVTHEFETIGRRSVLLNARRLPGASACADRILLGIEDVTEVLQLQTEALERQARYRALVQAAAEIVWTTNAEGAVVEDSPSWREFTGQTREQWTGFGWLDAIHPGDRERIANLWQRALAECSPLQTGYRLRHTSGAWRWTAVRAVPVLRGDGSVREWVGMNTDISERKRAELVVSAQSEALELFLEGASLDDLLGFLVGVAERDSDDGMLAAITLLNEAGTRFERGIGPSLPDAFNAAVEGVPVDSPTGLCAKALTLGEEIAVPDFNRSPEWQPFGLLVAPYGLKSGWSTPIKSSGGRLLGSFANYYLHPGDPTPKNRALAEMVTRIAAIAIERRRTEEALRTAGERFRLMAESMPQKIFTAKPGGEVDYFNPQWSEYTGLRFEEIRDWGWTQFIHPEDLAENVRVWQQSIDTGVPFRFEHRFRRAGGEYRWHLSRAVPLRDSSGAIVMWIGSNTDIHAERQRADEMRLVAAELSEADRKKSEFLALLAHELRNPLAPILNALHLLDRSEVGSDDVRSATSMLNRQVGQLARLVDDLLDVSRINRGTIELRLQRVELASIVNFAVEASRPLCAKRGQELTVRVPPEPVYLHADPARLAQVVGNLLNNACKFTDRGGSIELSVAREGARALIRVRDTGIGIAPEAVSRVFDMFMQADASLERSAAGLGIGLALVKTLVELHGGSVEARSGGLGQGSEFEVSLPIRTEATVPIAVSEGGPWSTGSARRVLIVDDNHDAGDSLAKLLQLCGHQTRNAYDGLEALEVAASFQPEVVLLDIGLPKLNGYEVARRLRGQPGGGDLRLIALTGWGQEEDRLRSAGAGIDFHLVKPVDLAELTRLLALEAGPPAPR